jgi:Lsr2
MGTLTLPTLPTGEQQQILRLFLRGRDAEFIGQALGLPAERAQQTITDLAGDDEDRAAKLLAACDERGALVAAARGESRHPQPIPRPGPRAVADPVAPAPQPTSPVEEPLLDRAAASDSARTRKLGERIRALTGELRARVAEEDTVRREQQAREQARLDAEQRVEQLAAELAAATEELRELAGRKRTTAASTPATPAPARDHDPRVVREWAKRAGVECNAHGRVPQTVVAAWRASTEAVPS